MKLLSYKFLRGFFKNIPVMTIAIFIAVGCQPEYLSKEELADYVNDPGNGLSKTQKFGDTEIMLSFKPTDLLILQENGWDPEIDVKKHESLKVKYQDHYYFTLSLSRNNKEVVNVANIGPANFSSLVETLSFRMGEYANLTTIVDTIPVADYIFSRTYGMSHSNSLLFVFSKKKVKDDRWIQFNLKEFGLGLGNINFRFDLKDINDIPKIKFNEITVKQQ